MKTKYVYLICIIVLIIAAIFSVGYNDFDEHFQILEFAGLKLNMTAAANLSWEYHYQMRPAIQPAIVVLLFDFLNIFGINSPFTITTLLRLLSAALAFTGMYLMYKAYCKTIPGKTLGKWFLLLSFLLWFMIYNSVRFASENWSGSFFLIAFALLVIKDYPARINYLLIGLILGSSFICRYQTGILIAGLLLWYLFIKRKTGRAALLALGVIIIAGAGVLIDRWFYGTWTCTVWNYFDQNLIQNKVSGFGTEPWWFYFGRIFTAAIPPFSLIFIVSFFVVFIFRRKDLLTWTIFPFLLIHFIIGHKEIRFLYPLMGFVPIVIIRSVEIVQEKWHKAIADNKIVRVFAMLFRIVNIAALAVVAFKPADGQIAVYNKIYTDYSGNTTLYYIDDNPYFRLRDICFYKRPNLEMIKISSVAELNASAGGKKLFVTRNKDIANDIKAPKKLIYSSFPEWLKIFNFSNWMARSKCWYVYELVIQ